MDTGESPLLHDHQNAIPGYLPVGGGATREPTEAELRIIGGFPADFWFGSKGNAWERIGNSVPPPLARALAGCIREHILGDREFTYISTFAGCGGSSLGYKMAGGLGLAAVEFDANAAETYRRNFSGTPVLERDIATVSAQELLDLTGLGIGGLDILDGSPPCQGFSTAGKREFSDPRNSLFREFVRLIEGLQPRVFVMENVSGMIKGKMKLAFKTIMGALNGTGYAVRCQLLNAMYYGVPQSRERLIWIGVRPDLGAVPTFPKAQGKPITVREALADVAPTDVPKFGDVYARLWPRVPIGGAADDVVGKGQNNCVKVNPDRPSPTLPKTQTGHGFATLCRWDIPRALSISEALALASFPQTFALHGTYSEQWARIGNSVPPLFMRAIAEHIRDTILMPAREQVT